MPKGIHNRIFKAGSCIAYGGNNKIYALKGGARYNEFYCYDISETTWTEKESLPSWALGKRYKVKAGGAMAYDGSNTLYAIKGNKCQELWAYNTISGHWQFQDTIPKLNKRSLPKNGAGLTFANNRLFIMKGNRTREFWAYIPQNINASHFELSKENTQSGTTQNRQLIAQEGKHLSKNIRSGFQFNRIKTISGISKIIYLANGKTKVKIDKKSEPTTVLIRLYDIQGRLVKSMRTGISAKSSDLELSLDGLSKGIYYLIISQ